MIPKTFLDLSTVLPEKIDGTDEEHSNKKVPSKQAITLIASRMHFLKKDLVRIISPEGVEVLYDVNDEINSVYNTCNKVLHKMHPWFSKQFASVLEQNSQRVVMFVKRDNYTVNVPQLGEKEKHRHFIIDKYVQDQKDVLERLVDRC